MVVGTRGARRSINCWYTPDLREFNWTSFRFSKTFQSSWIFPKPEFPSIWMTEIIHWHADLLGFSHTAIHCLQPFTVSCPKKEKTSSESQLCGWKWLVDLRGQKRMGRLVPKNKQATVSHIRIGCNQGMKKDNTAAEDHSCQIRTGNWGHNLQRLARIGKYKILPELW